MKISLVETGYWKLGTGLKHWPQRREASELLASACGEKMSYR